MARAHLGVSQTLTLSRPGSLAGALAAGVFAWLVGGGWVLVVGVTAVMLVMNELARHLQVARRREAQRVVDDVAALRRELRGVREELADVRAQARARRTPVVVDASPPAQAWLPGGPGVQLSRDRQGFSGGDPEDAE